MFPAIPSVKRTPVRWLVYEHQLELASAISSSTNDTNTGKNKSDSNLPDFDGGRMCGSSNSVMAINRWHRKRNQTKILFISPA